MDTHAPDTPEVVLERLEASIEEALHRLIDGGRVDNHHRESVEGFRRRLAELRQRIAAGRERGTTEMPADAKSDFDLLAWDYKRWIAEIDKDFETRTGYETGLGGGAPG